MRVTWIFMVVILLGGYNDVCARGFRSINPMHVPQHGQDQANKIQAYQHVMLRPVDHELVRQSIHYILNAYNNGTLEQVLDDHFINKSRLLDALTKDFPKDAVIKPISIQGISTLEQQFIPHDVDNPPQIISKVSAIVETQIEFEDINRGYQKLNGSNEFIIQVVQTPSQW